MLDDQRLGGIFGGMNYGPMGKLYTQTDVDREVANAVAAERKRWKQAAEAMAQEAERKFPMDGTIAHWIRALVTKRVA